MSKKITKKETANQEAIKQEPPKMPRASKKEKLKIFLSLTTLAIKRFLDTVGLTKGEAGTLSGSVCALVLMMAITVGTSNAATEIDSPEIPMAFDMAYLEFDEDYDEYEESEPDLDGVYVDGVYHARQVYAIVVNGEDIVFVRSNEDAEAVLDGIARRHGTVGSEIIDRWFLEDVEIIQRNFQYAAPTFAVDEAIHYIAMGTSEPRTHIIQQGDTLGAIAVDHRISVAAIEALNPGLDPRRLRIGTEILLYEIKPFITVSFTERIVTQERIPFGTIFEDTADMFRGQTQVRIPGVAGSKAVTTDITRENGIIVSTTIVSQEILEEPVTQVSLRGTTPIVFTGTASGELIPPLESYRILSHFGPRGGRHHNGIDLGAPRGTPVLASADGVVIQANTSGSFGKVIRIYHGDGLETLYSHNDENLVSVGENVVQGQKIATVGRTGNATGYHVHFEVRVNGRAQNPTHFIDF